MDDYLVNNFETSLKFNTMMKRYCCMLVKLWELDEPFTSALYSDSLFLKVLIKKKKKIYCI